MTNSSETRQSPDWSAMRRQMPVSDRWAYLDHAAVAPISAPARDAIAAWANQSSCQGGVAWLQWARDIEKTRRLAAGLVGSAPDEIALVPNTTSGISLVAEGYPWQPGDNVVTLSDEFPSNAYPWLNLAARGVEVRRVPVPAARVQLNSLDEACDSRTRIVAVSWVGYVSGWRNDPAALAELAHRRGALLMLDAIQALGVFPLDVQAAGVDFLAADGHKWLLGPEGAGILYVRREHLNLLRPLGVGWNSVVHAHDYARIEPDWKPSAARYEGGSCNMPGLLALGASLALLAEYGPSATAQRVVELTDEACRRLARLGARFFTDRTPGHTSGIVSFDLPRRDAAAVRKHCQEQGVVLRLRSGWLRISPHAYNNDDDLDRLMAALASAP